MKHSDLGLRKYLTEALGVREVMGHESRQKVLADAPLGPMGQGSLQPLKLIVVVGRTISPPERQLIQKMVQAIDEGQVEIVENAEELPPAQATLAMGDLALTLCQQRAGSLYHTFDPADLIEGDPFTVKQRKAQAWETLKELRGFIRSLRA